MVSKEKLEDILHDEEVEARWKSIRGSKKIKIYLNIETIGQDYQTPLRMLVEV